MQSACVRSLKHIAIVKNHEPLSNRRTGHRQCACYVCSTLIEAVHVALLCCSGALLIFCVAAAPPGAMKSAEPFLLTALLLTGPLLVPAALFHERKQIDRRDAALMLPWTLVIALLIVQAAPTTATFAHPLKDSLWRSLDQHIGISIPAIMALARSHPRRQFRSLLFLCVCSASTHPVRHFPSRCVRSQRSSSAIRACQCIWLCNGFALHDLSSGSWAWIGWNFPPDRLQQSCQATIYALRHGSLIIKDSFGGIVCLPSFHVFWRLSLPMPLPASAFCVTHPSSLLLLSRSPP